MLPSMSRTRTNSTTPRLGPGYPTRQSTRSLPAHEKDPQPPPEIRSGDSSDDMKIQTKSTPSPVCEHGRQRCVPASAGVGEGTVDSLCSDDELLDDDNEPISSHRSSCRTMSEYAPG
ncbi:uncharacterized protein [Salvelinus sp. IW2-2015]|uniref:uncharacterized protein n=1 Tax=Salvelinus sp. IW2-2015 TaxID=2691554 RepID=UPI0038D3F7FA